MLFPITELPRDLQLVVLSHLDLPELAMVEQTGKHWKNLATEDFLWREIAKKIPSILSISIKEKNGLDSVFKQIAIGLNEKIKSLSIPENIQKTLTQASTIGQIKMIPKYLEARDKIITWKILAQLIKQNVPELDNLNTYGKMINQGDKFSEWFNLNQTELAQCQMLDLSVLGPLIIGEDQLTSLPPEIGQLIELKELFLSGNQLRSLPPEIGQLKKLQTLSLTENQFSFLPSEIGQLENLQWLFLKHNQLRSLPPETGQLKKLQEINLYGNPITSLPFEMYQLEGLQILRLSEDQLSSLPPEVRQWKCVK